jgi:hypothetical protein
MNKKIYVQKKKKGAVGWIQVEVEEEKLSANTRHLKGAGSHQMWRGGVARALV